MVNEWLHPADHTPPIATKILLYMRTGIALIGHWSERDCLLWMPLPKVSREMKLRLERERQG